MATETLPIYTKKDFQTDQEIRWCPGCGDYAILSAVQSVFAELGVRRLGQVLADRHHGQMSGEPPLRGDVDARVGIDCDLLEPADVLVDSMRGRSTTWTRIRLNLIHVPEDQRPEQEPLEVDYDPWGGHGQG